MWKWIKRWLCKHDSWKVTRIHMRKTGIIHQCTLVGVCKGCGGVTIQERWAFHPEAGAMQYIGWSSVHDKD